MDKETVKFERTMRELGSSDYFAMPKEIKEFLDLKPGDQIILIPQNGKHGKYAAIWKKENNTDQE